MPWIEGLNPEVYARLHRANQVAARSLLAPALGARTARRAPRAAARRALSKALLVSLATRGGEGEGGAAAFSRRAVPQGAGVPYNAVIGGVASVPRPPPPSPAAPAPRSGRVLSHTADTLAWGCRGGARPAVAQPQGCRCGEPKEGSEQIINSELFILIVFNSLTAFFYF